jgi:competence protein ComEC
MQELKVKNVIISKQFENSNNFQEFLKIVKDKEIEVNIVEKGDRVNIEKNLYFNILWPDSSQTINENSINNNAMVCKLVYGKFSILFTGDIEEKAEKKILELYKNNLNVLSSNVLKVAHHGSKTSSTEEFLNSVKPQIALIGVGVNNNFGHPNSNVITRLNDLRCKNL